MARSAGTSKATIISTRATSADGPESDTWRQAHWRTLARSGVGRLTLIDLDVVAESNLNRQAHATLANLGRNKVDAMQERVASFAPDCAVTSAGAR